MIIGVFLRGYKAFYKTTYVPLTDRAGFSALIGDNGVGKSSVLEALDTFFNNERFNRNKFQQQRGQSRLEDVAFVSPVFLLGAEDIKGMNSDNKRLLRALSKYFKDIPDTNKPLAELKNHISRMSAPEESYILALSRYSHDKDFDNSLINITLHNHLYKDKGSYGLSDDDFSEAMPREKGQVFTLKNLASLRNEIIDKYAYVYIPVEANEADFTKLESKTVERLTDNDLFEDIADIVNAKVISKEINKHLDAYLKEIEENLPGFSYDSAYRKKFTHVLLIEKIIEGYFSTKTLHQSEPKVPISDLSAGEKRQALLAFSTALLERAAQKNGTTKKVIFALDEPEASLHISRVYEQIEKLKSIAGNCAQVLITTHWYGFIPVLDDGWVHSLSHEVGDIEIESFDLANFYHETRKVKENSKGERPLDANLKGNSELVQTIINSAIKDKAYTWVICEGITDAKYLKTFLAYKELKNIKIIPVAGIKNVLKLYKLLHPVVSDYKDKLKSAIVCVIDTDDALPCMDEIQPSIPGKLLFRRLCNDPTNNFETKLVDEKSTLAGKTTIEDVLPPKSYLKTIEKYAGEIGFKPSENLSTEQASNSYNCLDLKTSQKTKLLEFFERNEGINKVLFSNDFCEEFKETPEKTPWIDVLVKTLQPKKKKGSKK